jgi:iron complex outermembrane receptor protein
MNHKQLTIPSYEFLSAAVKIVAAISLFFLSAVLLLAQSTLPLLQGSVSDARGSMIANAAITVRNDMTGHATTAKTDSQGHFSVAGLLPGTYTVEASAVGFDMLSRKKVEITAEHADDVALILKVRSENVEVTVDANATDSVAAQIAPMDGLLDARSARTEIRSSYVTNFTSPVSDYTEVIEMAPGTFSVNSNGVGLGDGKTYFRGFSDGSYDVTFDGIPFNDTNSPTHHSWAFFPSQWIGGVDFDRSPGSAATVGPTPFGGSINLLSKNVPGTDNLRGGVSYGSFNTILTDVEYDTGRLGANHKTALTLDVHHLTSDGFETFNAQQRTAGAIKVQYAFTQERVLTGFSGVLMLDANTPNTKGPTRAQYLVQYNYLLQNTDPTKVDYVGYNFYHVPTDFEYIGFKSPLGKGWRLDTKPYTYSYYNQQNYALTPKTGVISTANCAPTGKQNCGTDKLNSYRKYGDIATFSQVSKYGIFRGGLWYEWASTKRHQIPQDPTTGLDAVLPNFNENFITKSTQPFAEYEYHPTGKLSLTGGLKFAHYTMDLTQFADNGSTIGSLNGAPSVFHSASFNSVLPSADANFRIHPNWSVYAQFATGSIIPPSNVFDVAGAVVSTLPDPTTAKTYQGGTVLKLKRVTINGDVYYVKFGNTFVPSTDPNNPSAAQFTPGGDSSTKGFEGESNISLTHGLSIYLNGTVGSARYISSTIYSPVTNAQYANQNLGLWVASTPANTEGYGLSYSQRGLDFGFFTKRVGPMWNDNKASYLIGTKSVSYTANQVIPIDPFSIANLFFNYTVHNHGHLDNTKLRLSFNNLFDTRGITSVTAANSGTVFTPNAGDTLGLLPGRSVMVSVVFGVSRHGS